MRYLLIISFFMVATIRGWTQRRQGFVPINDGQLYYEKNGSGPPLVFLHGVCLDHRMWQQQVDYFSKSYTCINVDLRGFGKSSLPDSTAYSFHEDIKTLLDSLQIKEPVVLIALSMGGKAAINFSLAYPRRTKALILADAAVDGYSFRDFKLDRIAKVAQQKGIDTANQLFLDEPIFAPAKRDSAVFARVRQMVLSYSGWQWVHKNPIHGLAPPANEQLTQINVPVLILIGEKDIWDFQQIADILHNNIKQSLEMKIADAGHMCNMEKPDAFNRFVTDFLNRGK
ncbi:MAG TPA: alpha/beta hydrolase [Chitinophagaceae bacterium]|jgi:3-oxoadipate enol-lactonase|nr:alpha/beta hydrolase [Chitinophagaceae bacterium]